MRPGLVLRGFRVAEHDRPVRCKPRAVLPHPASHPLRQAHLVHTSSMYGGVGSSKHSTPEGREALPKRSIRVPAIIGFTVTLLDLPNAACSLPRTGVVPIPDGRFASPPQLWKGAILWPWRCEFGGRAISTRASVLLAPFMKSTGTRHVSPTISAASYQPAAPSVLGWPSQGETSSDTSRFSGAVPRL